MPVQHPPQPLRGNGVVLRKPSLEDVPRIVEACRDAATALWTRVPKPYAPDDAIWFVNAALAMELDAAEVLFVIARDDDPEVRLQGVIGVRPDLVDRRAELGYWSHPEGRGRGLMTGAVDLASAWCLDELDLHRMTAETSVHNVTSQRVLERCGFTREATLREHLMVDGAFHDAHVYGRLRGEAPSA